MAEKFDVIVVGSGFGGAVTSCRLAQAGRSVLVLERGREWSPETYPRDPGDDWIWNQDDPARRNGWMDLRFFDDMIVAQGAGVGGGSLIYANVFVEAQPWVFESGWPSGITYEGLREHYETAGDMLQAQTIPDNQLTRRFELVREAAGAAGYGDRFRKVPLAVSFSEDWNYGLDDPHDQRWSKRFVNRHGREQGTCIHCGNCDVGCPVRAKNTLDLNYLAAARAAGAEVRALHLVRGIVPIAGGYRVDYERITDGGLVAGSATATRVVLAAGSLGRTELLLRARDEAGTLPRVSPQLGHRWSSNGDFLTPAFYSERRVEPTRGPTITCAVDFLDGSRDGERFFVEDGGFPNLIGNTVGELATTASKLGGVYAVAFAALGRAARNSTPLEHVMPWFGQAADAADGRLHLGRPWWRPFGRSRLLLDWDVSASQAAVQALIDTHKLFSQHTGGLALEPPGWTLSKDLITPHPLGGCAMGEGPHDGVVDANGEVFGHAGLHVADGAVFPRAVGLNPSRTIAALAEHIAAAIVGGRTGAPA